MHTTLKVLVAVAALAMPGSLSAQKLTAGTWTGSITPPNSGALNATFDVRIKGDSTLISLKADGREFNFTDVKAEGNQLSFSFTTGVTVKCALLRQDDKSYSGPCSDGQGEAGKMVMAPPKS